MHDVLYSEEYLNALYGMKSEPNYKNYFEMILAVNAINNSKVSDDVLLLNVNSF